MMTKMMTTMMMTTMTMKKKKHPKNPSANHLQQEN
jgi:hypothetical protein